MQAVGWGLWGSANVGLWGAQEALLVVTTVKAQGGDLVLSTPASMASQFLKLETPVWSSCGSCPFVGDGSGELQLQCLQQQGLVPHP